MTRTERSSGAVGGPQANTRRGARLLAVAGALVMAFALPAGAAPGAVWIEICTSEGVLHRLLPGSPFIPQDPDDAAACHAACTLPRKRAGR